MGQCYALIVMGPGGRTSAAASRDGPQSRSAPWSCVLGVLILMGDHHLTCVRTAQLVAQRRVRPIGDNSSPRYKLSPPTIRLAPCGSSLASRRRDGCKFRPLALCAVAQIRRPAGARSLARPPVVCSIPCTWPTTFRIDFQELCARPSQQRGRKQRQTWCESREGPLRGIYTKHLARC